MLKNYGPEYVDEYIIEFIYKVLDNIEKDMAPILDMLKRGSKPYDVVNYIESKWLNGIRSPESLLSVLRSSNTLEFFECLVKAVDELRECMRWCILEVLFTSSWLRRFSDVCPWCVRIVSPLEPYMLIPSEYGGKLAFRVHKKCFEELKTKACEYMKQGLRGRELFRKLYIKYMPSSIVYETILQANICLN